MSSKLLTKSRPTSTTKTPVGRISNPTTLNPVRLVEPVQKSVSNPTGISRRELQFNKVVAEVHKKAICATLVEMVRALQKALSTRLVAFMTEQSDRNIQRLAKGDIQDVKQETKRRLITAYEVLCLIDKFERPGVASTWFIATEPQLGFAMPAEAIQNNKLEETLAAARSFVYIG